MTCYFCHSIESVTGTHNNPLTLASNGGLFGPFADPVPGSPHNVSYSRLLDGATSDSANACGSCHDIQNLQGAHVERTFAEWTATTLSETPGGQSCAECHMLASDGAVSTTTPTKIRRVHSHMFPAVDLAVGDFPAADAANGIAPQNAAQQAAATAFLATAIQQTLCLNPVTHKLLLTLDNVGASGHSWPSGATPDRRAWVELTAYQGGNVIYASGNTDAIGAFPSALPLEGSPDPDLWLIRDCIYDGSGAEVQMFWQAVTVGPSNQLPGLLIQNVNDPTTFQTHFMLQYPSARRPARHARRGEGDRAPASHRRRRARQPRRQRRSRHLGAAANRALRSRRRRDARLDADGVQRLPGHRQRDRRRHDLRGDRRLQEQHHADHQPRPLPGPRDALRGES